jgi:DNA adenine methylase
MTTKYKRPFLKWPGGKYRLLSHISPHLPQKKVLIEPFVGAGAVFLNHDFEEYWLNDINPDLINLYKTIKRLGPKFIVQAQKWFVSKTNNPTQYYRFRSKFNNCDDKLERAFLFLYLNRHGYNGLCRYNQKGIYNVPFGRYKKPYFPETEIQAFIRIASKLRFFNQDFARMMNKAKSLGDDAVIYCDPPYAPLSKTANFTAYSTSPFALKAQEKLGVLAKELATHGTCVLISNHDLPLTRKIYRGAKIVPLKVTRLISCMANERKSVSELLAIFGGS